MMNDDEFDMLVDATVHELRPHLEGRPWAAVVMALLELVAGSMDFDDQDEVDYVNEAIHEVFERVEVVTIQ